MSSFRIDAGRRSSSWDECGDGTELALLAVWDMPSLKGGSETT